MFEPVKPESWKWICFKIFFFTKNRQKSFVQKQPPEVLFNESVLKSFYKVHRKTPVLESLF